MVNSSNTLTLYVDGACRGNGQSETAIGGWGVLILDEHGQKTELYGGESDTTNNRMELTAAIEGIRASPAQHSLVIYTDSSYVQKGMTEWIKGWKAKNWKNVKNPDLWQTLDQIAQGRQIEWKWIKGHAGHEGNERADQLANLGADSVDKKKQPSAKPKLEEDWLLNDPFGLGDEEDEQIPDQSNDEQISNEQFINDQPPAIHSTTVQPDVNNAYSDLLHAIDPTIAEYIKITPRQQQLIGERLLILDTETTGFYYQDNDRIIEVGAIEMINRRLTGSSIHIYINPQKAVGESENIHGLSDDFLADKPLFNQIAEVLYQYLKGAEIVAHNATFDMNFLNAEFNRTGLGKLSDVCGVTDTLLIAKRKHPGQKNSLDALVRRYEIPARDRTFHGALLDAEILADVYLAMTGGQVSLDIDQTVQAVESTQIQVPGSSQYIDIPIILPKETELQAHQQWMQKYNDKNENPCFFTQPSKT